MLMWDTGYIFIVKQHILLCIAKNKNCNETCSWSGNKYLDVIYIGHWIYRTVDIYLCQQVLLIINEFLNIEH